MVGCSSAQDRTRPPAQSADDKRAANKHSAEKPPDSPDAELTQYFDAISAGRFDNAFALWRTAGNEAPVSAAALKSRYAGIAAAKMAINGSIRHEGAAGTVYTTVAITLDEQLGGGVHQTVSGACVLARSHDVPGSTTAQRQWHLHYCGPS